MVRTDGPDDSAIVRPRIGPAGMRRAGIERSRRLAPRNETRRRRRHRRSDAGRRQPRDASTGVQPPTQTWLAEAFPAPTEIQRRGWTAIASGAHSLLIAPTGSGKTLAAFLAAIDACAALPPDAPPGVRVLYVSPLKALVYDIERNLRAPLVGIGHTAARLGHPLRPVRVAIRTGDTPQPERQHQAKEPAEILVTTPESLFLILGAGVCTSTTQTRGI